MSWAIAASGRQAVNLDLVEAITINLRDEGLATQRWVLRASTPDVTVTMSTHSRRLDADEAFEALVSAAGLPDRIIYRCKATSK